MAKHGRGNSTRVKDKHSHPKWQSESLNAAVNQEAEGGAKMLHCERGAGE